MTIGLNSEKQSVSEWIKFRYSKLFNFDNFLTIFLSMAGNFDLRAPSSFKVLGDNTNLSKAWEQYFKRFEYYLKATGVTKDEQKRALLLQVAGEEVQDIIDT